MVENAQNFVLLKTYKVLSNLRTVRKHLFMEFKTKTTGMKWWVRERGEIMTVGMSIA